MELAKAAYRHILAESVVFEHLPPAALDQHAPLGLYGYQPDPGTKEFPLALISPASDPPRSHTLATSPVLMPSIL